MNFIANDDTIYPTFSFTAPTSNKQNSPPLTFNFIQNRNSVVPSATQPSFFFEQKQPTYPTFSFTTPVNTGQKSSPFTFNFAQNGDNIVPSTIQPFTFTQPTPSFSFKQPAQPVQSAQPAPSFSFKKHVTKASNPLEKNTAKKINNFKKFISTITTENIDDLKIIKFKNCLEEIGRYRCLEINFNVNNDTMNLVKYLIHKKLYGLALYAIKNEYYDDSKLIIKYVKYLAKNNQIDAFNAVNIVNTIHLLNVVEKEEIVDKKRKIE